MSTGFAGRLFGPGQPRDGAPVRASFAGTRLHVDGLSIRDADAGAVQAEAAGFDQNDVLLSWSNSDGDWGLVISDAAAKAALLATAPAVLAASLARWRRSVGITRGIWSVAIVSLVVLLVGAGLLWWQYDRAISWAAAKVSPETERRLGQQMVSSLIAEGRTVTEGTAYKALSEIGSKLTPGSRYQYEWYLVDSPQVNAFAAPGGFVIVNAGLIDAAKSADELAAVLAHEVQHVEQRHSLQQLMHQLGWATFLSVVLGDPSAITSIVLLQLGNMTFSRDLEARADIGGIAAMKSAGIPPEAAVEFFKTLRKKTAAVPALLSSHPATDERIKAIEAEIARAPCTTCVPLKYDWDAVRASLLSDGLMKRARSGKRGR